MQSPIYILHGWTIDQNNDQKWQPFQRALKTAGFDSHFLKLPGLSSPLDEVWQLDDYVNWIDQQLPQTQPIILLGHSFGGQLVIRYASLYPKKITKIILIDSAGIIDSRPKKIIKRKIFWLLAKLGKPFFKSPFFRTALYKLAKERDYEQANPLMRKVMALVINQEVTQDAARLTQPTQIIWGGNDLTTPVFMGRKFHSLIKQSNLKLIKDARHSPQFTHPQQVVEIITHFLKK